MIGFGYDLHRLEEGNTLILGGITIESDKGTVAHSDGDVLIHSLVDAILGAAGLDDIGTYFPETDMKYKNYDSTKFLEAVEDLLANNGFYIVNIDIAIIVEKPMLSSYKPEIRANLASLLKIPVEHISVKAKTNEQQDAIGQRKAIAVYSVCQLEKRA
ncbi:MAG: 2-C-methyl-D-erythritol 2,4-cyclodiphosphate synthase [Ignavibacteria bacterium]|jgi:2-C-methyl-D-erythritol 2,4-cyclodiphosphate synthase|nr:2-C-methyl-D-erythritol 2,4-cyclodiphosphate synthase [Ignavibacteria bacterium]